MLQINHNLSVRPVVRQNTFPCRLVWWSTQALPYYSQRHGFIMSVASRSKGFVDWCIKHGHSEAVKRDVHLQQRAHIRQANWKRTKFSENHINDKRSYYRKVYLKSDHWKRLRKAKLALNPACEKCGATYLCDPHHLRYKNLYDVTVDDLQTLCRGCHNKEHLPVHHHIAPLLKTKK